MDAKLLGSFGLGSIGSIVLSAVAKHSPDVLSTIGECVVERAVIGAWVKPLVGVLVGGCLGYLLARNGGGGGTDTRSESERRPLRMGTSQDTEAVDAVHDVEVSVGRRLSGRKGNSRPKACVVVDESEF